MTTASPKPGTPFAVPAKKTTTPPSEAKSTNGKVTMKFEVITPDIARGYLNRNGKNRSLSEILSDTYSADMVEERWLLNNQGIGFDEDGDLLDGQHRLEAIIKSGKPQELAVFYGLVPESRRTIDIGRKRTVADELKMRGITNNNQLAATVRMRLQYEEKSVGLTQTYRYSNAQIIQWAEYWNDDLQNAISRSKQVCQAVKVSPTVLSTAYSIMHEQDADMADAFYEKLWTGENMVRGNPIHTLRERLMQQKSNRTKWTTAQRLWMCLRAWNAARKGEELHRILLPEVVTGKNMIEAV